MKNSTQLERIKQKLSPLVRNKMRTINLMGGLKDEVRKETENLVKQILSDPINKAYIHEVWSEMIASTPAPSTSEAKTE